MKEAYLQAPTYRKDEADRWSRETEEATPGIMPVMLYDAEDHLPRWQQRLESPGGFRDSTVYTLHTVNGEAAPVRWLVPVIETARLLEGLQKLGVSTPREWKLMSPIHMNTTCNNGDIYDATDNATRLAQLAIAYVDTFHPNIPIRPTLETDNPDAVPALLDHGRQLFPELPEEVQDELASMANKHTAGDNDPSVTAAYLMAHYTAYGLTENHLFTPRRNGLFVLPQSEGRFMNMMEQSAAATSSLGIPLTSFAERGTIVTMSPTITSPHYYPHRGEPTLGAIRNPQQWPTVKQLSQGGLNGRARDEIRAALELIENDIGGRRELLINLLRATL